MPSGDGLTFKSIIFIIYVQNKVNFSELFQAKTALEKETEKLARG
jgi:hypothetical protein